MNINLYGKKAKIKVSDWQKPDENGQMGWVNTVITVDGKQYFVGGWWVHSSESAMEESYRLGWGGFHTNVSPPISEGCVELYCGNDIGDIRELAQALGVDPDDEAVMETLEEKVQNACIKLKSPF